MKRFTLALVPVCMTFAQVVPDLSQVGVFAGYTPPSGSTLGGATDVTKLGGIITGTPEFTASLSNNFYGGAATITLPASGSGLLAGGATDVTKLGGIITGTPVSTASLLTSPPAVTIISSLSAPASGLPFAGLTDATKLGGIITAVPENTASLLKSIYDVTVTGSLSAPISSAFAISTDVTRFGSVTTGANAEWVSPVTFSRVNSPNISDVRGSVNLTYSGTYSGITYDVTINIICNAPYSCVSAEGLAELVSERLQGKQ